MRESVSVASRPEKIQPACGTIAPLTRFLPTDASILSWNSSSICFWADAPRGYNIPATAAGRVSCERSRGVSRLGLGGA